MIIGFEKNSVIVLNLSLSFSVNINTIIDKINLLFKYNLINIR
jgi:hypothetical protein